MLTKEIQEMPCYGAEWRKPPEYSNQYLGHLRQGSLIPNIMITQVETESGKCWAIVLRPTSSLEDIQQMQMGLTGIVLAAVCSDVFDAYQQDCYFVLSLLQELLPTTEQMYAYEKWISEVQK